MYDTYEPKYLINRTTGCSSGKVPSLTIVEAIEQENIKAVHTKTSEVLYGTIETIDFSNDLFILKTGYGVIRTLPLKDYSFFSAQKPGAGVPKELDAVISIGEEMFNVIHDDPITVWQGSEGLLYYSDDIQSLITEHGGYNVLSYGDETGQTSWTL